MVRASFGLYTTQEEISALATALTDIATHIDRYRPLYQGCGDGSYRHRDFHPEEEGLFDIEQALAEQLDQL